MCWTAGAGNGLPCLPELEQRFEPRDAAADEAQLDFDGHPHPQLEAVPCDVIRFFQDVVGPVDADAAGDDGDQAEAEERDESEPLRERQPSVVKCRQWKHPRKEVERGSDGGKGHHQGSLAETITRGQCEVPVAREGAVTKHPDDQHPGHTTRETVRSHLPALGEKGNSETGPGEDGYPNTNDLMSCVSALRHYSA